MQRFFNRQQILIGFLVVFFLNIRMIRPAGFEIWAHQIICSFLKKKKRNTLIQIEITQLFADCGTAEGQTIEHYFKKKRRHYK